MLAALVLLAAPAAHPCVSDGCSNDPLGTLGDERICWHASAGATYYVLGLRTASGEGHIVAECASTNATCKDLPGTACYGDSLVVKACKPDTEEPIEADLCSEWSIMEPVEVLPYACVRGWTLHTGPLPRDEWTDTCEEPCYQGAPRRLPLLPECPP